MSGIQDFSPLWGEWTPGEWLGEGSFGTVWEISRKVPGNPDFRAAVKHISIPQDEKEIRNMLAEGVFSDERSASAFYDGQLRSLMDEVNIMHRLRGYTNIVSYEDHLIVPKAGGIGYDVFLRMELLRPLTDVMQNEMPRTEVLRLGRDIGTAVQVLNTLGMVHRDIKPQNIFVNETGDYKLGDYGTARALKSDSAAAMSRKGTFNYMAPEIFLGNAADATVDLYSLGLVLYRLVNGNRLPFLPLNGDLTTDQYEGALARRMKGEPLPPPAYADEALSRIILKACAYDPKKRYRTAEAFLEALKRYESQISGGARPSPEDISDRERKDPAGEGSLREEETPTGRTSRRREKVPAGETPYLEGKPAASGEKPRWQNRDGVLEVEYKTWQPQERTYHKKEEFNRRDTSAVLPPRERLEIPEESFNWDEKSFIQPPQKKMEIPEESFSRNEMSFIQPPPAEKSIHNGQSDPYETSAIDLPQGKTDGRSWEPFRAEEEPPTAGPDGKTPSPKEAEELWRKGWQYSSSALNDYPSPDRPTIRPYGTGNPGEGAGVSPDPREKRRTPARGSKWVLPVVIGEVALILIVILVLSRLGLL